MKDTQQKTRFRTSYDICSYTMVENHSPSKALPDLTFTIKELSQRFQINQLLLYNKQAQAMFDIKDGAKITDDDFDRPSINLPKNFDLVDSYNATKKFVAVKEKFRKQMQEVKKQRDLDNLKKQLNATGTHKNVAGNTESSQNS